MDIRLTCNSMLIVRQYSQIQFCLLLDSKCKFTRSYYYYYYYYYFIIIIIIMYYHSC